MLQWQRNPHLELHLHMVMGVVEEAVTVVVDAGTIIEMVGVQDLTGTTVVVSVPIHIEECPFSMYNET